MMPQNKMNTLVIVSSYHQKNTEKVAMRIARVLHGNIVSACKVNTEELSGFDLIGFGSGIYDSKHHEKLLELADRLPVRKNMKAFIFSTDGAPRFIYNSDLMLKDKMNKDHEALRIKLKDKGYEIIGEFNCPGFNKSSFLKYIGGFNKGRPNEADLQLAERFAFKLKNDWLI